jgi:hypothetical protein
MVDLVRTASVPWQFSTKFDDVYTFLRRPHIFMPRTRERTATEISKEIDRSHRSARKLIKQGMKETKPGTAAFLNHVRALADLDQSYREERAGRGLDAQDLGTATKTQYVFTATVPEDSVERRNAGEQLWMDKMDAEFAMLPAARDIDHHRPELAGGAVSEEEQDQLQVEQLAAEDEPEYEEGPEDLEIWEA